MGNTPHNYPSEAKRRKVTYTDQSFFPIKTYQWWSKWLVQRFSGCLSKWNCQVQSHLP